MFAELFSIVGHVATDFSDDDFRNIDVSCISRYEGYEGGVNRFLRRLMSI